MSDDELAALYAAVLASDDDAPRLVLGDYLLSRGDPRGELIQVQCTLGALAATDPRRYWLRARENLLLAGLPAPPEGTRVDIQRGFPQVTVEAFRVAAAIPFLAAEPMLDRLTITRCGGGGDERWREIGRLIASVMNRVRALRLDGVIWEWVESNWDDVYREPAKEEIDETPQCATMLASLPPRPATLAVLDVPARTVLPDAWKR